MAKLFSPRVGQNFGEAFLSTIDRERKLRQQQLQFQQDQAFRNRQLDFLNVYREGILANQDAQEKRLIDQGKAGLIEAGFTPIGQIEGRKNIRTDKFESTTPEGDITSVPTTKLFGQEFTPPPPETPKELQTTGARVGKDGFIYRWNPNTKKYEKTNLEAPIDTTGDLTTPFTSRDKLRDASIRFGDFRNLSDEMQKSGKDEVTLPDGTVITKERLKVLREQAFDDVVFQTDERAKQLNSIYENFDQAFRRYLKLAEDGKLTKNNIDSIISRDLKGAPADMIKEMKDLLKSRVF